MRITAAFLMLVMLFGCNYNEDPEDKEPRKKPTLSMKDRMTKRPSKNGDGAPPKTTFHKVTLTCRDRGEDENGIPQYDVYVKWDSTTQKVGTCNACAPLDIQDYHEYDIPREAVAAVGGWFAGSGNYYYAVRTPDDGAKVYGGWQDEEQIELNDSSFHYKLILERHP